MLWCSTVCTARIFLKSGRLSAEDVSAGLTELLLTSQTAAPAASDTMHDLSAGSLGLYFMKELRRL